MYQIETKNSSYHKEKYILPSIGASTPKNKIEIYLQLCPTYKGISALKNKIEYFRNIRNSGN